MDEQIKDDIKKDEKKNEAVVLTLSSLERIVNANFNKTTLVPVPESFNTKYNILSIYGRK